MTRKVTNRRVGPENKENPTGKHKSLLQKVTYSYSSHTPFNRDEWERNQKEFRSSDYWTVTPLLEGCRLLAITYLESSVHNHTKCENWKWGFMTSKESKAAADLDGGFAAAFGMLFSIYCIEKDIARGDMEKAIVHSLRLVHDARAIVTAELEPLYHAGKTKTDAANRSKVEERINSMTLTKPIYQLYYYKHIKTHGRSNASWAAKMAKPKILEEYGISVSERTIKRWFEDVK